MTEPESFAEWLAKQEGDGPHPVPQQFIRWVEPEEDEPLAFDPSAARVRRLIAEWLA